MSHSDADRRVTRRALCSFLGFSLTLASVLPVALRSADFQQVQKTSPLAVKKLEGLQELLTHRALSASVSPAEKQTAQGQETITIIRDFYGIPHIFAYTDEGAMFGLGYVSAEDRLVQMEYSRRVVQGRLAEMLGDVGTRGNSTLDSDLRNRHQQFYAHCKKVAGRLDENVRSLLQAYSDGVNRYIGENRSSLHPLFSALGLSPEPWMPEDSLAVWERIARFFSPDWAGKAKVLHSFEDLLAQGLTEEEAIARLTTARIIDEEAAVVLESDFDPALRAELESYAASLGYKTLGGRLDRLFMETLSLPSFSHAWVVGGKRTTTGAAVLVAIPRLRLEIPRSGMSLISSARTLTPVASE